MTPVLSFAIVLPVYNEETIIERCIHNIQLFLKEKSLTIPIVAINDGSHDGTAAALERAKGQFDHLIVKTHPKNAGYGQACRTGFSACIDLGVDYALVMDADGTQAPVYIERFFPPMHRGVDFIKATRYAKGGKTIGVGWQRKTPSYLGNKLGKLVLRLPLTDYTNGFRAIKTSLLKRLQTQEKGFSVLIEEVVCAKKLGVCFEEVPYILSVRPEKGSGSKFIYSWNVYRSYLCHLWSSL